MTLKIPANLQKYVVLSEEGDIVDRFKCPIEGCKFTTRLGPGAVRMHILIKADPKVEGRYDKQHEEFAKNAEILDMDYVKTLAEFPRKEISD
ncbi:hypothetical protein GF319_05320 [Candidatus Bathyarchaeota archaeon]|jgi:hypothetical protein|nr:hypothetical protein [Candidatus Bathyarchaeota archaeon]